MTTERAALRIARTSGGYCLQLRLAPDDALLLTTAPIADRPGAEQLADVMRRHAGFTSFVHVAQEADGRWRISLSTADGALLAAGPPYAAEADARRAADRITALGPHAELDG